MHIYVCSRHWHSIGMEFLGRFSLTSGPRNVEYPQYLLTCVIFFTKHHREFSLPLTSCFVIRLEKKDFAFWELLNPKEKKIFG
jgi:hypothetical protein